MSGLKLLAVALSAEDAQEWETLVEGEGPSVKNMAHLLSSEGKLTTVTSFFEAFGGAEAPDIEDWNKAAKEEQLAEAIAYLVTQGVAEDHALLRHKYAHLHFYRVAVLANQALKRIRESKKKMQYETSQSRTGEVLSRIAPSSGGCDSLTGGGSTMLVAPPSAEKQADDAVFDKILHNLAYHLHGQLPVQSEMPEKESVLYLRSMLGNRLRFLPMTDYPEFWPAASNLSFIRIPSLLNIYFRPIRRLSFLKIFKEDATLVKQEAYQEATLTFIRLVYALYCGSVDKEPLASILNPQRVSKRNLVSVVNPDDKSENLKTGAKVQELHKLELSFTKATGSGTRYEVKKYCIDFWEKLRTFLNEGHPLTPQCCEMVVELNLKIPKRTAGASAVDQAVPEGIYDDAHDEVKPKISRTSRSISEGKRVVSRRVEESDESLSSPEPAPRRGKTKTVRLEKDGFPPEDHYDASWGGQANERVCFEAAKAAGCQKPDCKFSHHPRLVARQQEANKIHWKARDAEKEAEKSAKGRPGSSKKKETGPEMRERNDRAKRRERRREDSSYDDSDGSPPPPKRSKRS